MISREEIKKLADLARIELKDKEIDKMREEIDPVLDYVGQVSDIVSKNKDIQSESTELKNVMRKDENPNNSGVFSKELIEEFPNKDGDYLKVKKIL